jgi:DNA-binding response OmpR family regulator
MCPRDTEMSRRAARARVYDRWHTACSMEGMAMERRPRVLVIDDDPAMREVVVCMLDVSGFDAEPAANADEALFALQARPYELAVCDIYMPRRDGFGFVRAARRIRPTTPIVLMSSFGCNVTRAESEAAGAVGFISKPFSIGQLRDAVRAALAMKPTPTAPS